MSDWIKEMLPEGVDARVSGRADRWLRAMDVALAAPLLGLLALPLLVLGSRWRPQVGRGPGGGQVRRWCLALPGGVAGRVLAAVGAADWPVLWNILRGDMAFVGPRLRGLDEAPTVASHLVRPGLVNPWFLRRRTAVDHGTEAEADRDYLLRRGLRHDAGLLLRGALAALLPAPATAAAPGRVRLVDVTFDNVDMAEALARLDAMLDEGPARQVCFVNPACINIAARQRGYRRVLRRAALVLPDGIGVKIGADLLGTPLRQNVNGTDLFPRWCEALAQRGARVFLLGGRPGVAEAVAAEIGRRWPGLRVTGARHGYFAADEEGEVAAEVRASGADVLLVARGVPGQDLFVDRHLPLLGVRIAAGVGGLFDFVSGRVPRAPQWMRESGLEWVYRLIQEPGRLWRRYLIGNASFLARVLLQRAGLRRPARDDGPAPGEVEPLRAGRRAVVFATGLAGDDVPVAGDHPVALLPLHGQTLVEQLMARLAGAGVGTVELVACDRPEALRALLGDGRRWGLTLRWHLVKEPTRPYAVLATLARRGTERLIVGHADRCLPPALVERLLERDELLFGAHGERGLAWTGWAGVPAQALRDLPPGLSRLELAATLSERGVAVGWSDEPATQAADDAVGLLRAQHGWAGDHGLGEAPGSWVRHDWGAMSPLAVVEDGAELQGPVWIGPGCLVQRGARIGPNVVLSRDVVVSGGTHVADSVVLPGSYLGRELDLVHAVVNGARVRHVQLRVETALPESDGVLLSLAAPRVRRPALTARALAAALHALALPALGAHVAWRRLSGRAPAWRRQTAVLGRDPRDGALRTVELACTAPGAARGDRLWVLLAGLVDVAAGRRLWFGMRPRSPGEWYALRAEWQAVLSGSGVGLLHLPCWSDDATVRSEAQAAADVFGAVLAPARRARLAVAGGFGGA